MKNFSLILATDDKFGIGLNNRLPWKIPQELIYFQEVTTGQGNNAVIMGRKTWESLPDKSRPLKNRVNIVVSHNPDLQLPEGVSLAQSLDEALGIAEIQNKDDVFLIGGAQLFAEGIKHSNCTRIYLTRVEGDHHCDTFFDSDPMKNFNLTEQSKLHEQNGHRFTYEVYGD